MKDVAEKRADGVRGRPGELGTIAMQALAQRLEALMLQMRACDHLDALSVEEG